MEDEDEDGNESIEKREDKSREASRAGDTARAGIRSRQTLHPSFCHWYPTYTASTHTTSALSPLVLHTHNHHHHPMIKPTNQNLQHVLLSSRFLTTTATLLLSIQFLQLSAVGSPQEIVL